MTDTFFTEIPPVLSFRELYRENAFHPLPQGWSVVISDIVNSTSAIERGRYKEVNGLAVAFLTAVLNHAASFRIPYVFGGDGAALCVPPSAIPGLEDVLASVKEMAEAVYGLRLRTGVISVEEVRRGGSDIRVGRLKLSERCDQAVFSGGGMTFAETILKSREPDASSKPGAAANYEGLECRWKNIPAPGGQVMSLIVAPNEKREEPFAFFRELQTEITRVYGSETDYHPVREGGLRLSFRPGQLSLEHGLKTFGLGSGENLRYAALMFLQNLLGWIFMGLRLKAGNTDWGRYKKDLIRFTDFRKLDDAFRGLIAGRPDQHERLIGFLKEKEGEGLCRYGVHLSSSSLITCLVRDHGGEHYHFLDGADGGYAMAAKMLKSQ